MDNQVEVFARYQVSGDEILVESGLKGMPQQIMKTQFKLHGEATRKALSEAGYALVPVEPTVKTLDSMDDAFTQNNPGISGGGPWFGLEDGTHESIYKAMISAAQEDSNAN